MFKSSPEEEGATVFTVLTSIFKSRSDKPPPSSPAHPRPSLSRLLRGPVTEPVDKRWVYATNVVGTLIVARQVASVSSITCVSAHDTGGTCMVHFDDPTDEEARWAQIAVCLAGISADSALNNKRRTALCLRELIRARKLLETLKTTRPNATAPWTVSSHDVPDYESAFHDGMGPQETAALNACYAHAHALVSAEIEAARELTRALYDRHHIHASQWEARLRVIDRNAPTVNGFCVTA